MNGQDRLYLRFHGRIIDSLGIQMYQSPVAAIAELIANAWDADARNVRINLPNNLSGSPQITIQDDGNGMTFQECQDMYLDVGRNRRIDTNGEISRQGRPVLGRKGIGKFAGFGIARILEVDTSTESGRTVFTLDLNDLRSNHYISTSEKAIPHERHPQAPSRGTTITLKQLTLRSAPNPIRFAQSMARRFLINQTADDFKVIVNGQSLPEDNALMGAEFDFPNDYKDDEKPAELEIREGIGHEKLDGNEISWRIRFTSRPIDTEELRGVSVFCGIKVAQTPFFFNLSGGLDGQHGQQYVSGRISADHLDRLESDAITTERQRINWELPECKVLEEWGQARVRSLLGIWKKRRVAEKVRQIKNRLADFSGRLEHLENTEKRTVTRALEKLAGIETLSTDQFNDLSNGVLTAWEDGRLRELIRTVSEQESMDEQAMLSLLAEAHVLNALHVAEVVKAKVEIIRHLRERIEQGDLENSIRDHLAENPWLLSPEWETFRKERSINHVIAEAAQGAGLVDAEQGRKRLDLVLSSGNQLLVVELMRPGLTVDRDHMQRYEMYLDILRERVSASTGSGFRNVTGLLIADKLDQRPGMKRALERLEKDDMRALEWGSLLSKAESQWAEFMAILVSRAPSDKRLSALWPDGENHAGNDRG